MAKHVDTDERERNEITEHRPSHTKRSVVNETKQRELYGGFHFGSAFFGWLVTNGVAILLLALLAAAGSGYLATNDVAADELTQSATGIGLGSGIAILIVMMIAYYLGGYVAGRMSRFNGVRQGLGVWIIGAVVAVILAIAGGIAGSSLDALRQVSLPSVPIDGSAATAGGVLLLLATALLTLAAALFGGKVGEAYHRKIDRAGV